MILKIDTTSFDNRVQSWTSYHHKTTHIPTCNIYSTWQCSIIHISLSTSNSVYLCITMSIIPYYWVTRVPSPHSWNGLCVFICSRQFDGQYLMSVCSYVARGYEQCMIRIVSWINATMLHSSGKNGICDILPKSLGGYCEWEPLLYGIWRINFVYLQY